MLDGAASKQPHRLHQVSSAAELERLLGDHGVGIEELLAEHGVPDDDSYGLLVVGSIAERLATPSSDLDLLLLVDSPWRGGDQPSVVVAGEASRETLVYKNGLELNLEVVHREDLQGALSAFLEIGPLLFAERELTVLPIIGVAERHLLHRLRSGWPLRGRKVIDRWRDEFLVVLYPAYLALLQFISFNELREDAAALGDPDDGSFTIAARASAAEALACLLAMEGVTNPQPKWVMRLAERFLRESHPDLFKDLVTVLFLPRKQGPAQRRETLATLERVEVGLRVQIESRPELKAAAAFVLAQIDYLD